jgi:hypothetical protein
MSGSVARTAVKRIVWSWVGIGFGLLFIVGATLALFDDTVTCGGKEMQPGQTCVREKNGTVVSESNLEESKADGTIGKIVGIVMGVALAAVGAHNLRIGLRIRKHGPQPAVVNQPGVNHPAPGPWNQAPGAPQAWQQPQYQPMPQPPHYPQPPQHGWQQQPPPQQQPYPQAPQPGGHQQPPHSG